MSKYEDAIKIKQRNERLIVDFQNQVCTGDRDKTGLDVWRVAEDGSRNLVLRTDMYHGYYGNSSVSSDTSKDATEELAKTLTELKQHIITRTVARLQKQIEDAMKAASDEAERVLKYAKGTA